MIDKRALVSDLTDAFINYQHRLDCPMPSMTETPAVIQLKYREDPIFHAKVNCLVSSVMHLVGKHT